MVPKPNQNPTVKAAQTLPQEPAQDRLALVDGIERGVGVRQHERSQDDPLADEPCMAQDGLAAHWMRSSPSSISIRAVARAIEPRAGLAPAAS